MNTDTHSPMWSFCVGVVLSSSSCLLLLPRAFCFVGHCCVSVLVAVLAVLSVFFSLVYSFLLYLFSCFCLVCYFMVIIAACLLLLFLAALASLLLVLPRIPLISGCSCCCIYLFLPCVFSPCSCLYINCSFIFCRLFNVFFTSITVFCCWSLVLLCVRKG